MRMTVIEPVEDLPKVTPSLLARGLNTCPRKARSDFERRAKTRDAFLHWRIRWPFVDSASLAHVQMRAPLQEDFPTPAELTLEEEALWVRAVEVYRDRCGGRARVEPVAELEAPMPAPKRGVRIAGGVDLLVECDTGDFELRQFEFWGKPLAVDPLENWVFGLAVLRLARWGAGRRLLLRHIDLIGDAEEAMSFDFAVGIPAVARHFTTAVDRLRTHIADPTPLPGIDCGSCAYVAGCSAHRGAQEDECPALPIHTSATSSA